MWPWPWQQSPSWPGVLRHSNYCFLPQLLQFHWKHLASDNTCSWQQPDHIAKQSFLTLVKSRNWEFLASSVDLNLNKYIELKGVISNAGLAQGFKVSGWLLLLADNCWWSEAYWIATFSAALSIVKLLSENFWDLTFTWPTSEFPPLPDPLPDFYLTLKKLCGDWLKTMTDPESSLRLTNTSKEWDVRLTIYIPHFQGPVSNP